MYIGLNLAFIETELTSYFLTNCAKGSIFMTLNFLHTKTNRFDHDMSTVMVKFS